MPRPTLIALVVAIAVLVGACGAGGRAVPAVKSAVTRLDEAAAQIGLVVGLSTDEVKNGLRLRMPNASIDDLALQAERTADETAALQRIAAAQAAAQSERSSTLSAIHAATCDALAILDDMAEAAPGDQATAFQGAIIARLQERQLDATSAKVSEIWDAVETQLIAISEGGMLDVEQAGVDFACLA